MSYAIGCIGTSMNLVTKRKVTRGDVSLAQRKRLVPKRNQDRKRTFAVVSREGDPHVRLVMTREGQLHDVRTAFCFADKVEYLTRDGKKVTR